MRDTIPLIEKVLEAAVEDLDQTCFLWLGEAIDARNEVENRIRIFNVCQNIDICISSYSFITWVFKPLFRFHLPTQ